MRSGIVIDRRDEWWTIMEIIGRGILGRFVHVSTIVEDGLLQFWFPTIDKVGMYAVLTCISFHM